MVEIHEIDEEVAVGEIAGGRTGKAVGAGSVGSNMESTAGTSSTTRPSYLETLLSGMMFHNSDASSSRDSDKDVSAQDVYLKHEPRRNPNPAPLVADPEEDPALADAVEAPILAVVAVQAPVRVLADENDGFTVVRSRKHGMIRGRFPDGPDIAPPVHTCDNEVPWEPKSGPLRKTKQWSQSRKSGYLRTAEGPGFFVFGSFGANSSIEY